MKNITHKILYLATTGDTEAINYIIESCSTLVFYCCYNKLRNRYDAEECSQEILNKIANNLSTLDISNINFKSWVYEVIKHNIKNYEKKKEYQNKNVSLNNEYVLDYKDYHHTPSETKLMLSEVEKYIGEFAYQIIILRIGYDYTFPEISEILNLPMERIKKTYYRSIKKVENYLKVNHEKKR